MATLMSLSVMNLLSEPMRQIMGLSAQDTYTRLVGFAPVNAVEPMLRSVKPTQVLSGLARDVDLATCALAGTWLWFDLEPQAHAIVQSHADGTGAVWHAILHRREGDFSNAKYWVRQVGRHPAYSAIAARVGGMLCDLPADKSLLKLAASSWDAAAFVDLIADAERSNDPTRRRLAVEIQRCEWMTLFEWTVMKASGIEADVLRG
jgi:hypothetical protein